MSKKVEYALISLRYMAEKPLPHLTSAREICRTFGTPFDTTSKVLQQMTAAGILSSSQGVKGGHTLIKPLKQLNYYDLYQLLEGNTFGEFCNGPKAVCNQFEHCNIIAPMQQLHYQVEKLLRGLSLAELFATSSPELKSHCNHCNHDDASELLENGKNIYG